MQRTIVIRTIFGYAHANFQVDTDPLPPVINNHVRPLIPPEAAVSQVYSYKIPATNAKTFTLTGPNPLLPPNLTLDQVSGEIKGTPTACGSFSFTVTATNNGCTPDSVPLTINVVPMPSVDFLSEVYGTNRGTTFKQTCWTFKQLGAQSPVMSFKEVIPATITAAGVGGLQFFKDGLEVTPFAPLNSATLRLGKITAPVLLETYNDTNPGPISTQTINPANSLVSVTTTNTTPLTRLTLTGGDDKAVLVRISVDVDPPPSPTAGAPAKKSVKTPKSP